MARLTDHGQVALVFMVYWDIHGRTMIHFVVFTPAAVVLACFATEEV